MGAHPGFCYARARSLGHVVTLAGSIALLACTPTAPRTQADVARELRARVGHAPGKLGKGHTEVPPGVSLQDGLSENDAAALALWNSADFQATLAQLDFARADLLEAGALPNPVLSLLFPLGPKQLEGNLSWDISWLWKRPARVAAKKLDMVRVAKELVQHGLDLARGARVLHAQAMRSQLRTALLAESAQIRARIAEIADVKLRAGAASELEVQSTKADARLAALDVAREQQDLELALLSLRRVLGMSVTATPMPLQLTAADAPPEPPELALLLRRALASRPDLRAAELSVEAAGSALGYERAKVFDLIAVLDMNAQGKSGFEMGPGATLALPIFHQNQAGRERAAAELRRASMLYLAQRQTVALEVAQARVRLSQALQSVRTWPTEVLAPMQRAVDLATRAFSVGGTSHLVMLDATRRLVEAKLRLIELDTDARVAQAELSRSVGGDPYAKGK